MPRSARQTLAALLVALHATVMLCGSCLHGVPGWAHGPGLSRPVDPGRVHDPARPNHARQADDCPVCHFLSQAQLPVARVRVVAVWHVRDLKPEHAPERVTPVPLHSTSPRAPPAPAPATGLA